MDMEFINIIMEAFIKGIGKTIYKMDLEWNIGQINLVMRDNTKTAKNMVKGNTNGGMEAIMTEIGSSIPQKVL